MAKWIRTLIRSEGASAAWHILAGEQEYAAPSALCGERFPDAVESATSEERIVRDGRCQSCEDALNAKREREEAAAHR